MNEERLDMLLNYMVFVLPCRCPIEDMDIDEEEVPFCNNDFCEKHGGAECYRKWLKGEEE